MKTKIISATAIVMAIAGVALTSASYAASNGHAVRAQAVRGDNTTGRASYAQGQAREYRYHAFGERSYDDCFRPVQPGQIPGWQWNEVYTCNYSGH